MLPSSVIVCECVGCKDRVGVVGMNDATIAEWLGLRKCEAPEYLGRKRQWLGFCAKCVRKFSVQGEHMAPPIKHASTESAGG
jgi:hypothetical protein